MQLNKQSNSMIIIISSPSGAGKTTIINKVIEKDKDLFLSISATTRPKRPNEIDSQHYHFVSDREFEKILNDNLFLEHATVFGHRYGTFMSNINEHCKDGKSIVCDVDWQGAKQISANSKKFQIVKIFILPPSIEELKRRLQNRAQDTSDVIKKRMFQAHNEISKWVDYDYIIINNDLDRAVNNVLSIIQSTRLKKNNQPFLGEFVDGLLNSKILLQ